MNQKISIIVPCYNTEKYIERCLQSLTNQTYNNIEIIVVDDATPDKSIEIIKEYAAKDKRIKIVRHEKNKGLFQARLSGAKVATGDFISFIDSDDYVDFDFYRELIETIEEENTDIVVCNTVVEESNRKFVYNLFKTGKTKLEKEELLDEYFKQKGLNYRWHTVWNKLYRMSIWKKSEKYYEEIKDHLIMTEDFAFSTVLYFFANSLTYNERANYFYCSNDEASTSLNKLTSKKCEKNILDIKKSFDFVENFMKKQNIFTKYKDDFKYWKSLYLKIWYDNVKNANFDENVEKNLIKIIFDIEKDFIDNDFSYKDNFYLTITNFNEKLIELKEKIKENDLISFDMFDTLIYRPFYEPKDMFILLNKEFMKTFDSNGLIEFSKMRVDSEKQIRDKIWLEKGYEEVSLDEIYDHMSNLYQLDKSKLNKIKNHEKELELQFCQKRETAYSLYKLCIELGKKVVVTTDIYLSRDIIERILERNGYTKFDRIYISSEEKITKSTGSLFKHLIIENQVNPNKILHIGDNYISDVEIPKSLGVNSFYFPKTLDVFNNFSWKENNVNYCGKLYENFHNLNIDHEYTTSYMGNRVSYALIANKFFDNPFVSFNEYSDFNCNPYLIGYYTLGMHMLALSSWILSDLNEKNYDSICFMSRDGYLPYLVSKKINQIYGKDNIAINYVNVSRKSLLPVTLSDFRDFYKIEEYIQIEKVTPMDIINMLKPILNENANISDILKKHKINPNKIIKTKEKFNDLISIINYEIYDWNKFNDYKNLAAEYFKKLYIGKTATFDIGYSGQPELIISDLLKKSIDTYFIHSNNDSSFKNSVYANYKLNNFYDFKPTFTGTLREYLISSDSPTCIGYEKSNDNINPIFESKTNYSYFNKKMLEEIQNGCLEFINDFVKMFKNYYYIIDINKYYMSIPFEYFMHYSKEVDRGIFTGLTFEQNVSENIKMNEYWKEKIDDYETKCNRNQKYKTIYIDTNKDKYLYETFLEERVNHKNIFTKILYYSLFDRVALRYKIAEKLNHDGYTYKTLKKIYRALKRR